VGADMKALAALGLIVLGTGILLLATGYLSYWIEQLGAML